MISGPEIARGGGGGGTCGDLAQHELLGGTASQGHAHHVRHLGGGHQHILAGQVLRKAQGCSASGHDADLEQGLGMLQEPGSHCMPSLMVCHSPALLLTDCLQ